MAKIYVIMGKSSSGKDTVYSYLNESVSPKFNTVVMILISFLLIFLDQGASEIASKYDLNDYTSKMLTGIILFFILGSEFFINYKLNFRHKEKAGKEDK